MHTEAVAKAALINRFERKDSERFFVIKGEKREGNDIIRTREAQ